MKNSLNNIGEKIKLERLRANMTQSELAGDMISRNMLSLIEAGKARPSLETLEYISNKLDIPAGYFLCNDETTEALYIKIDIVTKAKKLFSDKKFDECIEICKKLPFDDEMNSLLAECELKLASENIERFHLTSALRHLSAAKNASERTIYLSSEFKNTIEAVQFFISCATSDIDTDKLGRLARKESRISAGVFGYLTILSYCEKGDFDTAEKLVSSFPFMTRDEFSYFKAKKFISDFKYSKALDILLELEDSINLSFISKYRILADIESCYENKRDFESAYNYSNLKHRMLESFGS